MALGAQAGDVLRLMVRGSMVWALAGVGAGIVGALGLTRLLQGMLYGVRPGDPLVLGAVALLLTVVALVASYIPARRAARVDPMVALRYQ
jgi:ABC-type antimicrobial peptide transport system permease subunit